VSWRRRDEELDEEIRTHLAMAERDRLARGETSERARAATRREFGNVGMVKELTREAWRGASIERLGRELRQILRGLVRRPGVTIAVAVMLSLGIGANAAVFTITDRLMFREPAGVPNPGTLHRLYVVAHSRHGPWIRSTFSMLEVRAAEQAAASVGSAATYRWPRQTAIGISSRANATAGVSYVSRDYFRTLNIHPWIGRFFTADENRFGAPVPVAVVSYDFWHDHFAADPRALGQPIRIGQETFSIVGVAPRSFNGVNVDPTDVWVPLASYAGYSTPNEIWYQSAGMLAFPVIMRSDSSAGSLQLTARVQSAIRAVARSERLGDSTARAEAGSIIEARGPESLSREERITVLLNGVTLLVLLLACANAANLLLAQALERRREMAVRLALGISRTRLAAHLVLESAMLALIAGTAASVAAGWLGGTLRRLLMPDSHWTAAFDVRVAGVTFAVALAIGVLVGLAPALEIMRTDVADALKAGPQSGGRTSGRVRSALMVAQSALSMVLLIGAGLFLRSFTRVRDIDLGYDVTHVITTSLVDRQSKGIALDQIEQRARALPNVSATALTAISPLWGTLGVRLFTPSVDTARFPGAYIGYMAVEPSYFAATGMRVLRGRSLTEEDRAGTAPVAVVSGELARTLWPGRDPIGQCVRMVSRTASCYTVVGIASDVHPFRLLDSAGTQIYVTLAQIPEKITTGGLVVRVHGDPAPIVRWLQRAVGDTSGTSRHATVSLMADRLAPEYRPWRLGAELLAALGALGALIAGFGLYAVISYLVARRGRELAIRIAVGARAQNIVSTVLGSALRLVAIGIVAGAAIAWLAGRFISGMLYQTSVADPVVLAAAGVVLLMCGAGAVLLPVLRATKIDPVIVLREE
jgi:putative ABC transport system permease protein